MLQTSHEREAEIRQVEKVHRGSTVWAAPRRVQFGKVKEGHRSTAISKDAVTRRACTATLTILDFRFGFSHPTPLLPFLQWKNPTGFSQLLPSPSFDSGPPKHRVEQMTVHSSLCSSKVVLHPRLGMWDRQKDAPLFQGLIGYQEWGSLLFLKTKTLLKLEVWSFMVTTVTTWRQPLWQ